MRKFTGQITGTIIDSNVVMGSEISNSFNKSHVVNSYSNEDIIHFVKLLSEHLIELKLSSADIKKAKAQIDTINANVQLSDEPSPSMVKMAGRTIKSILESAIGSLIANSIQPSDVLVKIQSFFSNSFS